MAKHYVERMALASQVPDANKETLHLLKEAEGHVWQARSRGQDVPRYRNPHLVDYLAIGRVQVFLPAVLDSCFIKVRLSEKEGVSKTFCSPLNLLRPSIAISTARHVSDWARMPDKLTALSTLSRRQLDQRFSRGEDFLMKMGAATGLTFFNVHNMAVCFAEGKECTNICPLFGSATFTNSPIVMPGDSSAPVFDQSGVLHGMISKKFETLEIGVMILFSEIASTAKDLGMELELA